MSYSQNDEERYILAAVLPTQNGRFLDIGAWNAFDKSNTRALYELGWSGVMFEPSPEPYQGLAETYKDAPCVKVFQRAVVLDDSDQVLMHVTADAVSTTVPEHYEKWKAYAKFDGQIMAPAIHIDKVFELFGPFDFVSLDTESTSVDLMNRMLRVGHHPRCICVEHDERTTEVLATATPLGYACVYANGENLVLVKQ